MHALPSVRLSKSAGALDSAVVESANALSESPVSASEPDEGTVDSEGSSSLLGDLKDGFDPVRSARTDAERPVFRADIEPLCRVPLPRLIEPVPRFIELDPRFALWAAASVGVITGTAIVTPIATIKTIRMTRRRHRRVCLAIVQLISGRPTVPESFSPAVNRSAHDLRMSCAPSAMPNPAAYLSILDLRRCSCNALKVQTTFDSSRPLSAVCQ